MTEELRKRYEIAPAKALTDEELHAAFKHVGEAFDRIREDDEGHGGSPGEWAWERCGELEIEIKKRAAERVKP